MGRLQLLQVISMVIYYARHLIGRFIVSLQTPLGVSSGCLYYSFGAKDWNEEDLIANKHKKIRRIGKTSQGNL